MNQTVKFGKLRASNDPYRCETSPGIHYGMNVSYNAPLPRTEGTIIKTTRASFVQPK